MQVFLYYNLTYKNSKNILRANFNETKTSFSFQNVIHRNHPQTL